MVLGLILACMAGPPPISGTQPAFQVFLVVHVDPLPREPDTCTDPALAACGALIGSSWQARTENLAWLTDRWIAEGRTMDLELGPESSLGWAGDTTVGAALEASLAADGVADPGAAVAETAALAQGVFGDLLSSGAGSLGVHVHTVLPDSGAGLWGDARIGTPGEQDEGEGGAVGACEAWQGAPLEEAPDRLVEQVVAYGARAAAALGDPLDADLLSFTGHFPRTMAGKIAVVEDPERLDPSSEAAFPERFSPLGLGSAYNECLTQAVDHPPFEAWPADEAQALLAGEGPAVTPGVRVVGSMAPHLGEPADGSLEAVSRQWLQALLNWRAAALAGAPARPWTFTFHTHDFDLYEGSPNPNVSADRSLQPKAGERYRQDLEGMASLLDRFAAQDQWQGVSAADGAVARWALPADLDDEGSEFSYGLADAAPPDGLDPALYPYLPLVAERLANTHLACVGSVDEVEIYGLLRCEGGWAWGEGSAGYHCADAAAPAWVYALVPASSSCVSAPEGAAVGGAVDDDALGPVERCADGIAVPAQGLLLEPAGGPWWEERCGAWPGGG